jgi:hypothetical protein
MVKNAIPDPDPVDELGLSRQEQTPMEQCFGGPITCSGDIQKSKTVYLLR